MDADPGDGEAAHDAALPLRASCYSGWWHHWASTSPQEHTQRHWANSRMDCEVCCPQPTPTTPASAQPAKSIMQLLWIQSWNMWTQWQLAMGLDGPKKDALGRDHVELEGAGPTSREIWQGPEQYPPWPPQWNWNRRKNGPWILSWHPPATAQRLPAQRQRKSLWILKG